MFVEVRVWPVCRPSLTSSRPMCRRLSATGRAKYLIRILNGTLYELVQVARERAKLPPLGTDARVQAFMTQAVLALSDVPLYPAPLVLTLADFTHVQASVFQVARAPGKTVVYLGCALLILGVFSMLYVRERRLWLWLAPSRWRVGRTCQIGVFDQSQDHGQ